MLTRISVAIDEAATNEMIHGENRDLTFDEIANIALKCIEANGMLPPSFHKDVNDFALYYSDDPGSLIDIYKINEWEPEND